MVLLLFIKLSRPVNLLIIAATMAAMYFLVLLPHYHYVGIADKDLLPLYDFLLLCLSTLMIAAGGYIINDYFDLKTDRINKPEKILIGKYIKRRVAMLVHIVLNTLAVFIGAWLSFKYKTIWPVAVHLFSTTMLWIYSLALKRKFLSGNVLIALLAFLTPMLVAVTSNDAINHAVSLKTCVNIPFAQNSICNVQELKNWMLILVGVFAFFAFLTNFIREIIKDMADLEGDKSIGCKTIPIVWGINRTKALVIPLLIISIILVSLGTIKYLPEPEALIYAIAGICIPLLLTTISLIKAKQRKDFLQTGNYLKIAMMLGIGVTWFIAQKLSA
jgi:4-hydroxybenzoate polyprenyltransferase